MGGGKVIEINDEAHWNSILADAKTQGKAVSAPLLSLDLIQRPRDTS
jgi:hypothetical protein